jgi:hypothetical protein
VLSGTGNSPPVAANDRYPAHENATLNVVALDGVLFNDKDPDGDTLTAVLVLSPGHGALVLNSDGSFTYTPNTGFFGTDSFTYQAKDTAGALSNVATVTLTVNPTPPVANNDSYTTNENTPLTVSAPGVLANDTDPNNRTLLAFDVSGPVSGTLTFSPDGSFTYVPNAGFYGTDSFTYQAKDTAGALSNVATVTITVNPTPPVANNDSYTTNENTPLNVSAPGVLTNDTDPNNLPLSAVLLSPTANGTLTLNADGSFQYTPNQGFFGVDSFAYRVHDTAGAVSNVAAVTINVIPKPPVANNDSYTTGENTPLTVSAPGVLANDTGVNLPLVASFGSNPANGSVTLNSDGSFVYTPNAGFLGTDSFTYLATDTAGFVSSATVTINVVPANDVSVTKVDNQGGSSVTGSVGTVTAGTSFTYTITVSNAGPSTANNVAVSDPVPTGLSSFVWSGNGHVNVSGAISDTIVSLAPNATVVYTITATVDSAATGTLSNTATVAAANDPNPNNNSATDTDTVAAPPGQAACEAAGGTYNHGPNLTGVPFTTILWTCNGFAKADASSLVNPCLPGTPGANAINFSTTDPANATCGIII